MNPSQLQELIAIRQAIAMNQRDIDHYAEKIAACRKRLLQIQPLPIGTIVESDSGRRYSIETPLRVELAKDQPDDAVNVIAGLKWTWRSRNINPDGTRSKAMTLKERNYTIVGHETIDAVINEEDVIE